MEIGEPLALQACTGKNDDWSEPLAVSGNRFDYRDPGSGLRSLFLGSGSQGVANKLAILRRLQLLHAVLVDVGEVPRQDVLNVYLIL